MQEENGILKRDKWDLRFMEMAKLVGTWSSCCKENFQVGAVIVKDKRILTTGYNGASSGIKTCKERGECLRIKLGVEHGKDKQICYAVHAEQNAIIQAARLGVSVENAVLYCTHKPCVICAKQIINSGIKLVIYDKHFDDKFTDELMSEAGVGLVKFDETEE